MEIFTLVIELVLFGSLITGQSSASGNPSLTSNYVGVACPDEEVIFTCTTTGGILRWTVIQTNTAPVDTNFIAGGDLSSRQLVSEGVAVFTASATSTSPGLISTLSTTASSRLEGVRVECTDGENVVTNETTIDIADPPSIPLNVRRTNTENRATSVSVTLQWGPPSDDGGDEVDSYTLSVSGGTTRNESITGTMASIDLPYNLEHTLGVSATNCAGSGPEAMLAPFVVNRVDCSAPSGARGVVIEPYSTTIQGSVVHYQCSETFVPNDRVEATCGSDGRWSPDPGQHGCTLVDCGVPRLPENSTQINTTGTLKGQEVTFQCSGSSEVITAVCTSVSGGSGQGVWSPDPEQVVCGMSCTRPGVPANGFLGEVTRVTAEFGCDSDPQRTRTAQCVATDTWNPDPAQEECSPVSTAPPVDCGSPQPPVNGVLSSVNGTLEGSEVTFHCNNATSSAVCNRDGRWSPDTGQQVCGFQTGASTSCTCTTAAVASAVACSVVFFIVGVVSGLLIYLITTRCRKTRKQVASGGSEPPNTAPPPPVYEDIELSSGRDQKAGIELRENVAYGPVKK